LNFRHFPNSVVLAGLLFWAPEHAFAWGTKGHEIAASVALHELDRAARIQVAALLGSDSMLVEGANWADEIRSRRRDTARWHFVDIPLNAPYFDSQRDCPMQACVVAQIDKDVQVLANPKLERAVRAEALLFLVHFVADLHQPLHTEDNDDKGGNEVRVLLGGERTNLHRVWDVDVVEPLGPDVAAIADDIERTLTPAQRKIWENGTPADWANETHAIARDQIYPPLMGEREVRLSRAYLWREAPLARQLLAKAGLRLAWLLNSTLK